MDWFRPFTGLLASYLLFKFKISAWTPFEARRKLFLTSSVDWMSLADCIIFHCLKAGAVSNKLYTRMARSYLRNMVLTVVAAGVADDTKKRTGVMILRQYYLSFRVSPGLANSKALRCFLQAKIHSMIMRLVCIFRPFINCTFTYRGINAAKEV